MGLGTLIHNARANELLTQIRDFNDEAISLNPASVALSKILPNPLTDGKFSISVYASSS